MARYRIVRDARLGYAAEVWRWYWPFWVLLNWSNTHPTVTDAEEYILKLAEPVVKYVRVDKEPTP